MKLYEINFDLMRDRELVMISLNYKMTTIPPFDDITVSTKTIIGVSNLTIPISDLYQVLSVERICRKSILHANIKYYA